MHSAKSSQSSKQKPVLDAIGEEDDDERAEANVMQMSGDDDMTYDDDADAYYVDDFEEDAVDELDQHVRGVVAAVSQGSAISSSTVKVDFEMDVDYHSEDVKARESKPVVTANTTIRSQNANRKHAYAMMFISMTDVIPVFDLPPQTDYDKYVLVSIPVVTSSFLSSVGTSRVKHVQVQCESGVIDQGIQTGGGDSRDIGTVAPLDSNWCRVGGDNTPALPVYDVDTLRSFLSRAWPVFETLLVDRDKRMTTVPQYPFADDVMTIKPDISNNNMHVTYVLNHKSDMFVLITTRFSKLDALIAPQPGPSPGPSPGVSSIIYRYNLMSGLLLDSYISSDIMTAISVLDCVAYRESYLVGGSISGMLCMWKLGSDESSSNDVAYRESARTHNTCFESASRYPPVHTNTIVRIETTVHGSVFVTDKDGTVSTWSLSSASDSLLAVSDDKLPVCDIHELGCLQLSVTTSSGSVIAYHCGAVLSLTSSTVFRMHMPGVPTSICVCGHQDDVIAVGTSSGALYVISMKFKVPLAILCPGVGTISNVVFSQTHGYLIFAVQGDKLTVLDLSKLTITPVASYKMARTMSAVCATGQRGGTRAVFMVLCMDDDRIDILRLKPGSPLYPLTTNTTSPSSATNSAAHTASSSMRMI